MEPGKCARCARTAGEILEYAYHMLRPGGRLCYSTCTFAPAENEGSVCRLLGRHGDLHVERCDLPEGFRPGRKEWAVWEENAGEGGSAVRTDGVEYTMRLWPHLIRGEGHFIAVIHKEGACEPGMAGIRRQDGEKGIKEKDCQEFCAFREQYLNLPMDGILLRFGEQLYLAPEETPALRGLKVLRPGLHLGSLKKNRFEPSHAPALALEAENVVLQQPGCGRAAGNAILPERCDLPRRRGKGMVSDLFGRLQPWLGQAGRRDHEESLSKGTAEKLVIGSRLSVSPSKEFSVSGLPQKWS